MVLDFFAGSGTTAHATFKLNSEDGGKRRFILVQLPEPLDLNSKEQSASAAFCDSINRPRNIAEITKERIRRAGSMIRSGNPLIAGDFGFRVFRLDSSNIRAWNPNKENLSGTLLANLAGC